MTARPARILAAAAGITASAPAGLAAALINAAIIRKPPSSDGPPTTATWSPLPRPQPGGRAGHGWQPRRTSAGPLPRTTAHGWQAITFPHPAGSVHGHPHSRAPGRRIADEQLRARFPRAGVNVLMADNRAHGDSGGRYVGMGWLDHFDYLCWIRRLIGTVGPDARIVLHGLSMGGATALLLSGSPDLPPQVRAVISDCSFSSATTEFAYHLRARHLPARLILPLASQMCRMLAGYRFTQASPLGAIADIAVPVLLIHGGADTYNPTAMAHELHAAQPHADLWIVPGADHVMSYFTDPAPTANASNGSCVACPRPDASGPGQPGARPTQITQSGRSCRTHPCRRVVDHNGGSVRSLQMRADHIVWRGASASGCRSLNTRVIPYHRIANGRPSIPPCYAWLAPRWSAPDCSTCWRTPAHWCGTAPVRSRQWRGGTHWWALP